MENLLIVGAGAGLSASLARLASRDGMKVGIAARNVAKLDVLARDTGARAYACDSSDEAQVDRLFDQALADFGHLDWVVFNPSARARGPVEGLDPAAVKNALLVSAYGGFLVGRRAAQHMLPRGRGSIFFTGATASVKGFPMSAAFAMGKFGLRGLAQSMARELAPKNIHVAHFVIDGGIEKLAGDDRAAGRGADGMLHPDHIAAEYLHLHRQHRSAWTWELELRPWVEKF